MTQKTASAPSTGDNKPQITTIRLQVVYPPAAKPFKDDDAPRTETIAQVKAAALKAFGLVETATKTFKLFHGRTEYSDPAQTIGQIAGAHQELVFQLEEFVVQG